MSDESAAQLRSVRAGGYFSAVPIQISETLRADTVRLVGTPWLPPALYGAVGHRLSAPDERVLAIWTEAPLSFFGELTKEEVEQLHFDRFCTDWLLADGRRPYTQSQRGPHPSLPPDFTAEHEGVRIGVDCVQFAIESRRLVNARFFAIKQAIDAEDPGRFAHLAGFLVYVWVTGDESGDTDTRPLKKSTYAELLDALAEYRVEPGAGHTVGVGAPEQAPPLSITNTGSGWSFYATPLLSAAPASRFFARTGFEMAFVHGSEHTGREGWADFLRCVVDHDQPEIVDLIVTIGGPDRHGFIHPSEDAVFELMIERVYWDYEPVHLRRIFAHSWQTGRIVELHPTPQVLSPGQFQGISPPHHLLAVR